MIPQTANKNIRAVMQANKSKNSKPELVVRKLVFAMGYRYRLHMHSLPGSPDLVFPARRKVIFVHGCFWHQHQNPLCPLRSHPKSNLEYWVPKLQMNQKRDALQEHLLIDMGWSVLTIWECEIYNVKGLKKELRNYLDTL